MGLGWLEVKCRRRGIRASSMDVIRRLQYAGLEVGRGSKKKSGSARREIDTPCGLSIRPTGHGLP
jgi:hypothetical protein